VLEPLDFIARLAALVPAPWAHLTCYHALFAASIEDPEAIARILDHRRERAGADPPVASLGPRAPPPGSAGMLF